MDRRNTLKPVRLVATGGGFIAAILASRIISYAKDEDVRRHEFILSVLLVGAMLLSLISFVASYIFHLFVHSKHSGDPLSSLIFFVFILGLYWLVRRGHAMLSSYILLGLLLAAATYALAIWGIDLPTGLLLYALVIAMTGVLVSSRAGLMIACVASSLLIGIALLQELAVIHPDLQWHEQPLNGYDAITFVAIFLLITTITWLSNREIERSLAEARRSEQALTKERNNLEIAVANRTDELTRAQAERVDELNRFAQFGRLTAGLLHDLSNPVSIASFSLDQVKDSQHSELIQQAARSVHQLERYIETARKQLLHDERFVVFDVGHEIQSSGHMLAHRAKGAGITLELPHQLSYHLYGNPAKFSQLITNLLANAIDAYSGTSRKAQQRRVMVEVATYDDHCKLTVTDWGCGIKPSDLHEIFKPFYSTKGGEQSGLGIGLVLVKQIAEEEFGGKVEVTSDRQAGTRFCVTLRNHEVGYVAT